MQIASRSARDADKLPHLLHLALKKREKEETMLLVAATFPCGTRIRTFSTGRREIKKRRMRARTRERRRTRYSA